jgi:hypothetical protein
MDIGIANTFLYCYWQFIHTNTNTKLPLPGVPERLTKWLKSSPELAKRQRKHSEAEEAL